MADSENIFKNQEISSLTRQTSKSSIWGTFTLSAEQFHSTPPHVNRFDTKFSKFSKYFLQVFL